MANVPRLVMANINTKAPADLKLKPRRRNCTHILTWINLIYLMFHFSFFHRIEKRNSALNFLTFHIYFFSISTPTTNKLDDVTPVKHFLGLPVILLELQTNFMTVYWLCIFRHWLGIYGYGWLQQRHFMQNNMLLFFFWKWKWVQVSIKLVLSLSFANFNSGHKIFTWNISKVFNNVSFIWKVFKMLPKIDIVWLSYWHIN